MGLVWGAIAFLFLAWDTPRILTSAYLWIGLLLGSTPVIAWYTAQFIHYGEEFISIGVFGQSLDRIWTSVEGNTKPIWYYLWELLKFSLPWLLFSVYGLKFAWGNRNWGWAKLILVWSAVYFAAVSLMATKLPWYIMPIYPALALAGGVQLAEVRNWHSHRSYPRSWIIVLGLLAIVVSVACLTCLSIYFGFAAPFGFADSYLIIIFTSVTLTMGVATVLVAQKDQQFIAVLFWGMYVSLLLFVSSPHWIWELNEAYPVKSVAEMIKHQRIPTHQVVYTSFDGHRPSLEFYSARQIIPATKEELIKQWQQSEPTYLLLDADTFRELNLEDADIVDKQNLESELTFNKAHLNWLLVTKNTAKDGN
ncbi:MAG: hypothetical protein F6K10_17600 [Moorea sp. SIO2B7]|nr:hypothetical protein [Moorena sp. SIO2B7]